MLNFASAAAVLIFTELFFISAWLSAGSQPWQYNLWAALAVLLWAQPWRRRDPYRTDNLIFRMVIYLVLIILSMSAVYIFGPIQPIFIALEAFILGILEYTGQAPIRKARS